MTICVFNYGNNNSRDENVVSFGVKIDNELVALEEFDQLVCKKKFNTEISHKVKLAMYEDDKPL